MRVVTTAASIANSLSDFGFVPFPVQQFPSLTIHSVPGSIFPTNVWRVAFVFFPIAIVKRARVPCLQIEQPTAKRWIIGSIPQHVVSKVFPHLFQQLSMTVFGQAKQAQHREAGKQSENSAGLGLGQIHQGASLRSRKIHVSVVIYRPRQSVESRFPESLAGFGNQDNLTQPSRSSFGLAGPGQCG